MLNVLTVIAALGCGLIAGVFYAFSTFIMKALGSIPAAHGIAAMQAINVKVINPLFLIPFMGTVVICLVLAIAAIRQWHSPGAAYLIAGALLYCVGTYLVTMVFNVPRNDALAAVTPSSVEASTLWATYLSEWTFWNHVRTAAAVMAAALFTTARLS
jgi:uncharacterized membrane protein